jgi:CRP-like cAMP-binding protein
VSNALIASLPRSSRDMVLQKCDSVELELGVIVCKPGAQITHVYFPTTSYISLITPPGAVESLEVGMVGNEGAFGVTLLLDVATSPLLGLVQGRGLALRIPRRRFVELVNQSEPFRRVLNRYLFVLTAHLAQTAACNRFHLLEARMARWLLMTQDRAQGASFRLTHQFLAFMLGARRAGVTGIAGEFQERGYIRYSRGQLTILDRTALQQVACACYKSLNASYRRYLGDPPKGSAASAE